MISYFIAYSFTTGSGFGFGNCQIDLAKPVRSQADITVMTDLVREQVADTLVVLSFTRFEDEAGNREAR